MLALNTPLIPAKPLRLVSLPPRSTRRTVGRLRRDTLLDGLWQILLNQSKRAAKYADILKRIPVVAYGAIIVITSVIGLRLNLDLFEPNHAALIFALEGHSSLQTNWRNRGSGRPIGRPPFPDAANERCPPPY